MNASTNHCVFSPDRMYRYTWQRIIGDPGMALADCLPVCFIMLNPSTADETSVDPTVRRCLGFARAWGYDVVTIVNLFAYRAIRPSILYQVSEETAIGPENDRYILRMVEHTMQHRGLVVAAWGNHGKLHGRADAVLRLLRGPHTTIPRAPVHAIHVNPESGMPAHPLYLKGSLRPALLELPA